MPDGTTLNLTTPAAGDGGYIYIGGNSLTEYDPTDPLEGSIIDNADISYMTRIEIQGGGIIDSFIPGGTPGAPTLADDWYDQLTGYLSPVNQFNSAMMFTIDDSNLSDFSDAAVFVHPDSVNSLYVDYTGQQVATVAPFPARGSLAGEPVVPLHVQRHDLQLEPRCAHQLGARAPTPPGRPRTRPSCSTTRSTTTRSPSRRSLRSSTARPTTSPPLNCWR